MEPSENQGVNRGYVQCLMKAMQSTRQLFVRDSGMADDANIHSVKSVLYAAIERAGIEIEQSSSIQQKLRELLTHVAIQSDASWQERQEALRLLKSLEDQTYFLIYSKPKSATVL